MPVGGNQTSDRSIKNQVMSGLLWRYLERCAAQGVQLLVTLVLARILEPQDFGALTLVMVFLNIALVFVQSGFGTALVQKAAVTNGEFTTVLLFSAGLGGVLALGILAAAPWVSLFFHYPELTPVIRVLALTLPLGGVSHVLQSYVTRRMEFRKIFVATLIGSSASAVLSISAALRGLGLWSLVIQQLSSQIISASVLYVISGFRVGKRTPLSSMRGIFSYGWRLLVSGLIDSIYGNLYTLVIGRTFSSVDVGYFDRGRQFPALIITNVNATIQSVAFPALARRQSDPPRVKEMTRRLVKTGTYVIFPCMAGLALISEPLVRLLLTEKWLPAVPYLRYYCLIYALWPVFTANLQAISAMGRSDIFLRLEVIKKALGVAILCVTLPMGLRAMMIGSCVNAVLGLFVNAAPNGRLMRYSLAELFADMAQPAVLTALMAAGIRGAGWGTAAVLAGMESGGAHIPGGMSDFILIVVQIAAGMAVYLAASVLGRSENLRYLTGAVKEFAGRSARAEGGP